MLMCLRQNIKEGLTGHGVDWYHEVFDIVFPNIDAKQVNGLWKEQLKEVDSKERKRKERKTKKKEEQEDDEDSDDD